MAYDRLYIEFIYYFNVERDYFECHEVMEELWLEEGRNPLYQGLLQVAVGLYHHINGNLGGAIKLFSAAIEKLEPYPDVTEGIRLQRLKEDSKIYLAKLHQFKTNPFPPYDLHIEIADPELNRLVEELRVRPRSESQEH
jgi:hypothetical protein